MSEPNKEPQMRNPFDNWMVQRNLEYVRTEGLETVVNRLRANGYNRVATQVELLSKKGVAIRHNS